MRIPRLSPNQNRLLYDALVVSASAVAAWVFGWFILQENARWLPMAPLAVLALNNAFGIYSRFRVGAGGIKALWLSLSLGLTAGGLILLSPHAWPVTALWAALTWSPLVL